MRLNDCHNHHDFRKLAQRRLPGPIFNCIDGAADDETTYRRNTASFDDCDLVPSVLRGAQEVDTSVTVLGQKLSVPFYCSPTALQRLFHHRGEHAVAAAGVEVMMLTVAQSRSAGGRSRMLRCRGSASCWASRTEVADSAG